MASVAVVFQSDRGHTKVLADAIFKSIKAVEGTKAQFLEIQGSDVFEGRFANETLMDRTRPL
jgi:flavodoxin